MQSGVGDRLRSRRAVNYFVQPAFGWRAVFFVGILPAFFTLWVRRTRRGAGDLAARARQRGTAPSTLRAALSERDLRH